MATRKQSRAEKPLDRQGLTFATAWRKYRDIYKAAEKAGVARSRAVSFFNRPEVQEEIDRQDEAVRMERAVQEVKAEILTVELIDAELMAAVKSEKGAHKQAAMELAYVRLGKVQAGALRSTDVPANQNPNGGINFGSPLVYQAFTQATPVEAPAPIVPVEQGLGIRDHGSENTIEKPIDKEPAKVAAPAAAPAPPPKGRSGRIGV